MIKMDDLFDELLLLSPEQVNYNKGLEEGSKISYARNVKQGKEYGLMIGFQKFLIVGQLEEILGEIIKDSAQGNDLLKRQCEETLGLLKGLEMSDNDLVTVERNDAQLLKIKNKMRLILMVHRKKRYQQGDLITFDSIVDVYNQVGNGDIPSSKVEDYYEDSGDETSKKANLVDGTSTDW